MNNFKDTAQIRGVFSLRIFNENNELIDEETGDNLIVDTGRNGLAGMAGGDTSGDKVIAFIGFGDNDTETSPGDVALADPFYKDVNAIVFASPTTINVQWTLELTENNGSTIREFGLLHLDGTLFARKVRGTPISKTSTIRLEGTWAIYF